MTMNEHGCQYEWSDNNNNKNNNINNNNNKNSNISNNDNDNESLILLFRRDFWYEQGWSCWQKTKMVVWTAK